MVTLADLIAMRKGRDTYETMARRAGMSVSALHSYAKGMNKDFPPPEAVMQISRAIGVNPWEIVVAASIGLGIEPEDIDPPVPTLGRSLPAEVDYLPPDAQRLILDTARVLVSLMQAHDPEADPAVVAARAAAAHNSAVGVAALVQHAETDQKPTL